MVWVKPIHYACMQGRMHHDFCNFAPATLRQNLHPLPHLVGCGAYFLFLYPTLLPVNPRKIAMMFAECSLVMLAVNAVLILTGLLEKISARTLMSVGLILAMVGLAALALQRAGVSMYFGIEFTSAGTGLVLPLIAYLAAGVSQHKLGATVGGLAAAAGLGQTLGSLVGGWAIWCCRPAELRMACAATNGVVGDADPAPRLMVGDSCPIHSQSCRYALKGLARCSLRQNNR